MVLQPCGFCGDEIKPGDDCRIAGLTASSAGAPIVGHRTCAETAQKVNEPKSAAKVITLD